MHRLYVITRSDLQCSTMAVQAGHAVAQFCIEHPNSEWNNNYLIMLQVENKDKLIDQLRTATEHDY